MKMLRNYTLLNLLLAALLVSPLWPGTTGKIAGTVVDKETGDPLPGANVVVANTSLGAAADLKGKFIILHVPPGTYEVEVSMIGYAKVNFSDVRVNIDQTTSLDVELSQETITGEEVTIVAERNIVKPDVATSVVAITDREVESLPVSDIEGVISLQAGIQGDLRIRGSDGENALFLMDGVTLRDPRNNEPVTKIALSAIQEISVERGGFNAEYGHVQSGIVNVVTKEGSRQGYHGSIEARVSPPSPKYHQDDNIPDVHDLNSFWLRPFFDDDVAWTGTNNGVWDEYTRRQYPQFQGWNAISQSTLLDNDPDNDLTPQAAQRVFMYEVRKRQPNDQADYNIDGGFGGPVPVISEKLGNLRFFTSYRRQREMLLFPLTRPDYVDYDWTLNLTSDITPSLKLQINGLVGKQYTMEHNWAPGFYPRSPNDIVNVAAGGLQSMFADWTFSLADIGHQSVSAKITHTFSSKSFYEVSVEHFRREYNTRPTRARDTETLYEIVPGYFRDENPFGYQPTTTEGLVVGEDQHASKARDFTVASATKLKADFTSQLNFNNLVKAGAEFVYNDLDFDYGVIASGTAGQEYGNRVQFDVQPVRAALYIQDKLETKGFTMNAGLRLDYSNSRANWWNVDPYNQLFFSNKYEESLDFSREESDGQWQLSPRLGIAHPITEYSKLFFNYGHFKQQPQYETMFRIDRSSDNSLQRIGDPNLILSKTISYELGYDHIIAEDFLLQLAAFYNDISDQQNETEFSGISGINYQLTTSNDYEDIRGFELTLRKSRGTWWSGFANYTYQVSTRGHFGRDEVYEDPSLQREYDENTTNLYQERPIPRPFARANLSLFTPSDFGPSGALGDLHLNLLLDWQAGEWVTWNPREIDGIEDNVESRDWFDVRLRFSKTFRVNQLRFQFLVDVNNVLNTRRLYLDTGNLDRDYMLSLHLPESELYSNIPGDDKVGDYREPGVEFQPMEYKAIVDREFDTGNSRVIYYEGTTGDYLQYVDGAWQEVDQARINQVLADKAYIDMPNYSTFWFLNPRNIFFGLRMSFDFN